MDDGQAEGAPEEMRAVWEAGDVDGSGELDLVSEGPATIATMGTPAWLAGAAFTHSPNAIAR